MPPVPAEVPCLPCARLQARAGGHDVICGKTPGVFANGRPSKQCDACRHGHKACRKVPAGAIVFALKLQQIAVGAEGETPIYKKYAKVFRAAYHALPPAEIEDSDPVILDTIRLSELIKERTYAARDAEIMGEQLRGVKRKLDEMLEAVEETLAAVGQEE